jgi:hypothetical protein
MQSSQQWFRHALRQTGWRPQRQVVALALLGIFLSLVMGALYLSEVAVEAARGREMRDLVERRDQLEGSNELLRVQIAELQSLTRLRARAEELGFKPASNDDMLFIVVEGYTANRSKTVAPLQSQDQDLPVYSESFGGWLEQAFGSLFQQFQQFSEGE